MDRRLNLFFEERREDILRSNPNEAVYIIRDAGGGVSAVEKTIYELNISEIHDYTHTNCGAMKFALSATSKIGTGGKLDEVESSPDVYDNNVKPFLGTTYPDALAIEKRNAEIQNDILRHLKMTHPGLKYTCDLIEIEKIDVPSSGTEHTLVIGMAYNGKYTDIAGKYNLEVSGIYFVQANNIDEVRASVKLAVERLNIHKVMFISNSAGEDSIMEEWSGDPVLKAMFDRNLVNAPVMQSG